MQRLSFIGISLLCAGGIGCNVWQKTDIGDARMALLEPAADQISLDISFVTVTPSNVNLEHAVWRDADEQIIDNDLRRSLVANGLRCAIVGEGAGDALKQLLADTKTTNETNIANGTGSLEKLGTRGQQMQLRTGRLGKVVATPKIKDTMVILTRQGDRLVGETVDKAQCVFGVRCYPEADGRVTIELNPEVEYGETKTRFVGKHEQSSWLMNSSRQRRTFPDLAVRPTLSVGQTLVLAGTPEAVGIGKQFFCESGEEVTKSHTLLLIRLVGCGSGNIFSPDTNRAASIPAAE